MAQPKSKPKRTQVQVDEVKLRRVQKLLGTSAAAEAVDKALDEFLTEHARIRLAWRAHNRLVESGIEIKDVYGVMD